MASGSRGREDSQGADFVSCPLPQIQGRGEVPREGAGCSVVGDEDCEPGRLGWTLVPPHTAPTLAAGVAAQSDSVLGEVEVVTWNPFRVSLTRLGGSHLADNKASVTLQSCEPGRIVSVRCGAREAWVETLPRARGSQGPRPSEAGNSCSIGSPRTAACDFRPAQRVDPAGGLHSGLRESCQPA